MGYLDRFAFKLALLDQSEDDDLTQPTEIQGYEIIGVITPASLDGSSNDIDAIEIDPGNGTFYTVTGDDGAAIDFEMDDFAVNEWLTVPPITVMRQKLVGARARLNLSESEDADRNFYLVLVALPGSSE